MNKRCKNSTNKDYKNYGGRGIKVCKEWKEFRGFLEYALTHGYRDDLTIERINVNGNYEPDNVIFIPKSDQARNRRNNIIIVVNGKRTAIKELSKETGIPWRTIYGRYERGIRDIDLLLQRKK